MAKLKNGFYKMGNRLWHVLVPSEGEYVSVHDWVLDRHQCLEELPEDCRYLAKSYDAKAVQEFVGKIEPLKRTGAA